MRGRAASFLAVTLAVAVVVLGACMPHPHRVPETERCAMGVTLSCTPEICATFSPDELPQGCQDPDAATGDASGGGQDASGGQPDASGPDALLPDGGGADAPSPDTLGWEVGDAAPDAVPDDAADDEGPAPPECVQDGDCGDGDACTVDRCTAAGACTHEALSCDDDEPCTVDSCDPASGCEHAVAPACQGQSCAFPALVDSLPWSTQGTTAGTAGDAVAVEAGECVVPNTVSLALDGDDDAVVTPPSTSFDYRASPGLSVSVWIKLPPDYAAVGMLLHQGANSWYVLLQSYGAVTWRPVLGVTATTGDHVLPLGAWAHLLLTYDNATGEAAVYVDGVQAQSVSGGPGLAFDSTRGVTIGYNPMPGSTPFPLGARVDEVALFPRVLNAAERQDLLDGARGAPASLHPDHWWRMGDGDVGLIMADHGAAPVDATVQGADPPTYQADTPAVGVAVGQGAGDRVYAWTAPADGTARALLSPDYDGTLAVTTDCGDLAAGCLGVDLRPTTSGGLYFDVAAGQTYYLLVDGVTAGDQGTFSLALSLL